MVVFKNGVLLLFVFAVTASLAGCPNQATTVPRSPAEQGGHERGEHEHGEHEHGAVGPHHGELIELGDGAYHGELLHDRKAGSTTIYILDGNANARIGVAEDAVTLNLLLDGSPIGFRLTADRTENDPAGRASRFILINKKVADALDQESAKGQLRVIIGGKPFSGPIEHGGHAH